MEAYINELNGLDYVEVKPFKNVGDAVKEMESKHCPRVIMISSGRICEDLLK